MKFWNAFKGGFMAGFATLGQLWRVGAIPIAIIVTATVILSGCGKKEEPYRPVEVSAEAQPERFSVSWSRPTNADRAVFLIRDNKTGQEYIALNGVGIVALKQ